MWILCILECYNRILLLIAVENNLAWSWIRLNLTPLTNSLRAMQEKILKTES